jgi:hypothetical protein
MALDPSRLQGPVDPEAVESRLLDDDDPVALAGPRQRLRLQRREQVEQRRQVTARNHMLRHLLPAAGRQRGDQPLRAAEFHRDEDGAKIHADSGRTLRNACCTKHGLLQMRVISDLTLAELRALSTPHGI